MRVRLVLLAVCSVCALVVASGASAKQFKPGDLRMCSHHQCVAIMNQAVLDQLSAFYYTGAFSPPQTRSPHLGARTFQLRFADGYVTGVVAGARLNRFLSFGVNLGRFAPRRWYLFPKGVGLELRTLAASLRPLRLTRRLLAQSG